MGGLFSKKNSAKVVPAIDKPSSAPSRLEGGLEPAVTLTVTNRRAITPQQDSTGTTPRVPSESEGTPKRKKIDVIGKQTDGSQLAAALPAAIQIPDDAQPWTEVLEERVVRSLCSGNWKDREEGLNSIGRSLSNPQFMGSKDSTKVYRTACQITAKSLKDKVSPIYHAALQLLHTILQTCCSSLSEATLREGMATLIPLLLHRCGNLNARIHEASVQAVIGVASCPSLGAAFVGPFVMAPLPKLSKDAHASAQMFGRLEVLYYLLASCSMDGNLGGLEFQETINLAKKGLESPDEKVRQCSIKVIVELYRQRCAAGEELEIECYLGPVKPALLQVLQRKFAEVASEEPGATGGSMSKAALATGIQIMAKPLKPLDRTSIGRQGLPPLSPSRNGRGSTPSTPSRLGRTPSQLDNLDITGRQLSVGKSSHALTATPVSSMARHHLRSPHDSVQDSGSPGCMRRSFSKRTNLNMAAGDSFMIRSFKREEEEPQSPCSMLDDGDEALIQYIGGNEKETAPAYNRIA